MIGRRTLSEVFDDLKTPHDQRAHAEMTLEGRDADLPWYGRFLAGASAWMSASLLLCSVGCLGADLEPLFAPIGITLLVTATAVRHVLAREEGMDLVAHDFGVQAALIASLLGRGLVGLWVFDLPNGNDIGPLVMAALEMALVLTYPDPLQRFASTVLHGWWLTGWQLDHDLSPTLTVGLYGLLGPLLLWGRGGAPRWLRALARPVGFGALTFAWYIAGAMRYDHHHFSAPGLGLVWGAAALALVAGVLLERRSNLVAPGPAVGLLCVGGLGLLTLNAPGLTLAAAIGILAFHRRDRLLMGTALVGLVGWFTLYYYQLGLSFSAKGMLLIAIGVVLLGLSQLPARLAPTMEAS